MTIKDFKLATLPVVVVLALTACSGSSRDDDRIVVPPDPIIVSPEPADELAIVVNGNVVNSATLNVVTPVTLHFREGSEVSQSIATVDGDPITEYTSADGSFSFTLREDADAEEVRVLVRADGYFERRFDVDLVTDDEDETEVFVEFGLVERAGEDVADAEVEDDVTDATTGEEITATASSETAEAEARIPQGTQLLNAAGDPITGTSVSLRVGAINPQSEAFSAAIPPGMNAESQTDVGIPTGVADVTMRDNEGNSVRRFSNAISVGMRLPVDTLAPGGDRTIETGDEFDLFSYDEETGEWSAEEAKGVVGQLNDAGTAYRVSFETDHLTWFVTSRSEPVCTSDFAVTYSGSAAPTSGLILSGVTTSHGGLSGQLAFIRSGTTSQTVASTALMSRSGVSANAELRLVVRDVAGNVWFDSVDEVPVCGTTPDLELENPIPEAVDQTVTLTAVCSNDTSVTSNVSGAVVRYRESGSERAFASARGQGDGTYVLSNLNPEAEGYTLNINPRIAEPFSAEITPDGEDVTVDFSLQCDEVTGTGGG